MAERGEYRSITRALINGPDFQALSRDANHVFLLLKINFGAAGIEVWYPDELVARISRQGNMHPDAVRAALDELDEKSWIRREHNVVWVLGHLEHDPHVKASDAKHRKSVQRNLAGLPHLDIVRAFVGANPDWFPEQEGSSMGLRWAFEGVEPKPKRGSRGPSKHRKGKGKGKGSSAAPSGATTGGDGEPMPEPPALPEAPSRSWVQVGTAWWREHVGKMEEPRFGKALKSAVDLHGWDTMFAALQAYSKAQVLADKTRKVEWFADDVTRWIPGTQLIGGAGREPTMRELQEAGLWPTK